MRAPTRSFRLFESKKTKAATVGSRAIYTCAIGPIEGVAGHHDEEKFAGDEMITMYCRRTVHSNAHQRHWDATRRASEPNPILWQFFETQQPLAISCKYAKFSVYMGADFRAD